VRRRLSAARTAERQREFGPAVAAVAEELSRRLGWSGRKAAA
jgi:DNA-binding IclR family transcriptional regulator